MDSSHWEIRHVCVLSRIVHHKLFMLLKLQEYSVKYVYSLLKLITVCFWRVFGIFSCSHLWGIWLQAHNSPHPFRPLTLLAMAFCWSTLKDCSYSCVCSSLDAIRQWYLVLHNLSSTWSYWIFYRVPSYALYNAVLVLLCELHTQLHMYADDTRAYVYTVELYLALPSFHKQVTNITFSWCVNSRTTIGLLVMNTFFISDQYTLQDKELCSFYYCTEIICCILFHYNLYLYSTLNTLLCPWGNVFNLNCWTLCCLVD